jgi:Peptidase family M23
MLTLYLLQTGIPLVLIAWLALAPPRSVAGLFAHSLLSLTVIVAISYVGIWTFPPWWTPYVLAMLLVSTVGWKVVHQPDRSRWPQSRGSWLILVGQVVVTLYAANETRLAQGATATPDQPVIALLSPFGPGTYLIANGGRTPAVNAHAVMLDQSITARRAFWGTAFGVDIVKLNRWGFRADGILPESASRYEIFGEHVVAPCEGTVIIAVDGLPDMFVPQLDREHLAGNHILLRCGDADILLGHFRQGSLRVSVGQWLDIGDMIAQVGNSGNTSEPHLHIHAQMRGTTATPFSGAPLPIQISGRYLVRNDRFVVPAIRGQP